MQQIARTNTNRWRHMAKGVSTSTASQTNTSLSSESGARVDMSNPVTGWREPIGTAMRFAAIFGESTSSGNYSESAVCLNSSGGPLLNRNVYGIIPIIHTNNVTLFVISSVVEFLPIME